MRINEEEIIGDLRTALREFSKPEDLDPSSNQPVTLMNRRGWESTSFRRGDFVLSGSSYIAELLRNYENGGKKALFTIRGVIRLIQETIEMEITGKDIYNRYLSRIYTPEYLNLKLVSLGLASKFLVQDSELKLFANAEKEAIEILFSEELGLVIEYLPENENEIISELKDYNIPYQIIGNTTIEKRIKIKFAPTLPSPTSGEGEREGVVLDEDMRVLRGIWEETSHQLDMLQTNPECVLEEKKNIYDRMAPAYQITFIPEQTPEVIIKKNVKPPVAIIREEGSNGDREMTSAFYMAGFDTWDVTMTDLMNDRITLAQFKGIAFVGGFSYADVLDSAKGWAGVIRFNKKLYEQFQKFYNRPDTFSLGICNGCQLMALLGWVPWQGIAGKFQPRFIHNKSGRLESRFATVKIIESPSIMLNGMEGSILGVWANHGEGFAHFPDEKMRKEVIDKRLAPIRYADDNGEITEKYPFNPNGSPLGIASLCTPDGRHIAMMSHPERTFLKWQWAWMPENMKKNLKASPWLKMFQNAREWCEGR